MVNKIRFIYFVLSFYFSLSSSSHYPVGAIAESLYYDVAIGHNLHNGVGVVFGGRLLNHSVQRQVVYARAVAVMARVMMPLNDGQHLLIALQHLDNLLGIADA